VNYLLDVNVLVAWGWDDHPNHQRAIQWVNEARSRGTDRLLTSAIPQMGFVRVSVQRSPVTVTPESAGQTLKRMLTWLGRSHRFVADDQEAFNWPVWALRAPRTRICWHSPKLMVRSLQRWILAFQARF
jgi:predicted nucleic acid-binding protein